MPLESATYISDFVTSNPAASDGMNNADDHMRLIKSALQNTFPGLVGTLTRDLPGYGVGLLPAGGNTATPAYAFKLEPALGFYHASPGTIGFTGTLRGQGAIPAGAIQDFAMATAPIGWLACDGNSLSTTIYAELFAAIGYTWGGSGATFNVPNLLHRFRRHRDLSFASGAVGLLQGPLNMTHTHAVTGATAGADTDHAHSGTTGAMNSNASHAHSFGASQSPAGGFAPGSGPIPGFSGTAQSTSAANTDHTHNFTTGGMSAQHAHAINFTSAATGDANEARPYSATVLTCIKV